MNYSIKINNYKGFSTGENGFEDVLPLNIIIGKNNSGKTTLIEVIQYLINPNADFKNKLRNGIQPSIEIRQPLKLDQISHVFPSSERGVDFPDGSKYDYGKSLEGKNIIYTVQHNLEVEILGIDFEIIDPARKLLQGFEHVINRPFKGQIFRQITAERDIIPESHTDGLYVYANGVGATNIIQRIINSSKLDSKIIEKMLLEAINKIVNPDIHFTDIVIQFDDSIQKWEIYFENSINERIALSKMGSGIKTVLLVLLNLLVIPKIENNSCDKYVFCFEELENNVHPSLLRRLFQYIKEYSDKYQSIFFITTHSNIVIDQFGSDPKAQIIHVKHDGKNSSTKTILSKKDQKVILKDLEIKASDLLQSNGIIWVEGPSDRVYLNRWLEILAPALKEGLHFSIMYYGGKILSNMAFDYDSIDKSLIPSLHINQNAFVIMDRDGKRIKPRLNETKIRIESEIGPHNCWITHGREIENYLTRRSLNQWLTNQYEFKGTLNIDTNKKLQDIIKDSFKTGKIEYQLNKHKYAKEISPFILKNDLGISDLNATLTRLIKQIKEWNGIRN